MQPDSMLIVFSTICVMGQVWCGGGYVRVARCLSFCRFGSKHNLGLQKGRQNRQNKLLMDIYSLAIIVMVSDLLLFSGILSRVLTSNL